MNERARLMRDPYEGYHNRLEEDYNGYSVFDVYRKGTSWYWSAIDKSSNHVMLEEGPFDTAKEAYYDAII
jgi:hypothetical protein